MLSLENQFEENVLTTKVDWLINWARLSSIWPMSSASPAAPSR
jgi:NADH:ubiquinone oxidoreductase subunit B-like Fe-S oxidoreductase